HVCAVLNCEHAPFSEVEKLLDRAHELINPFPVLIKGTREEIDEIIKSHPIYSNRNYSRIDVSVEELYDNSINGVGLMYGNNITGYPINKIILAIAYLIAALSGNLNGKRPKGNKDDIIKSYLLLHQQATVEVYIPEIMTPLIISMGDYSTMVGPVNPQVYKKLIHNSKDNRYKIIVDEIKEADLI
ncbi:MAG: hypothetical protein ACI38A_07795, partial [Candidatus Ornithomonoglobus sp.]